MFWIPKMSLWMLQSLPLPCLPSFCYAQKNLPESHNGNDSEGNTEIMTWKATFLLATLSGATWRAKAAEKLICNELSSLNHFSCERLTASGRGTEKLLDRGVFFNVTNVIRFIRLQKVTLKDINDSWLFHLCVIAENSRQQAENGWKVKPFERHRDEVLLHKVTFLHQTLYERV
jgi:hypothetical protein